MLTLVLLVPEWAGSIAEFDAHGVKNAWKLVGTIGGFAFARQIVKCTAGIALVLAVRTGLKPVLSILLGDQPFADAIRYFYVALTAGGLWPMTFGWFSRLGSKERR